MHYNRGFSSVDEIASAISGIRYNRLLEKDPKGALCQALTTAMQPKDPGLMSAAKREALLAGVASLDIAATAAHKNSLERWDRTVGKKLGRNWRQAINEAFTQLEKPGAALALNSAASCNPCNHPFSERAVKLSVRPDGEVLWREDSVTER